MRGHAAFTPPRSLQHNHVACGEIPSRLLQKFLICVLVDHDVDEIKSGSDGAEMGREVIEPEYEGRNGERLKAGVVGPCLKLLVSEVYFGTRDSGGETRVRFRRCAENI